MKNLGLVAIMFMAICTSASAQLKCSTKEAVIQHYMAKRITFAPFDVNKDGKADHLRNGSCHARAEHAHVEHANEQIVTKDVENTARGKSYHGKGCHTLIS